MHKIFYAVYLGLLPMITRRLDAKEREALSSGYCYAWEDRGPHAITGIGIERFTEGRHWSASRVRDVCILHHSRPFITSLTVLSQEFLFYYEKWEPPKNKNGERTRLVTSTPLNHDRAPIQQLLYEVMDSRHEIGTHS